MMSPRLRQVPEFFLFCFFHFPDFSGVGVMLDGIEEAISGAAEFLIIAISGCEPKKE